MSIFRSSVTRYVDAQGHRVTSDTPGAKKIHPKSKGCWYGEYRDLDGTRKRVKLSRDKTQAQRKLAELVHKVERRRNGLDQYEVHLDRPLSEHLADFRSYLENEGCSPQYLAQALRRIERVAGDQRIDTPRKIDAARIADWLNARLKRGTSSATYNLYLSAWKGFCRWLVNGDRLPRNPLAHLEKRDERLDVRLERRALGAEEFRRFVEAARESQTAIHRLSGADRAMVYLVAAFTGLRVSELASLTPSSLALDNTPPTLVVAACYSKRRRRDVQPLPDWLAGELRTWLTSRPREPSAKLWSGRWAHTAAKMLREDLEAARAKWIEEGRTPADRAEREAGCFLSPEDEAGRVFDFHALRHQFISNLAAAGEHPKVAQQLARHSTIDLTMNVYTDPHLLDTTGAVNRLPQPGATAPETQAGRATGTDGQSLRPQTHLSGGGCRMVVATGVGGCHSMASKPATMGEGTEGPESQETLEKHRISAPEGMIERRNPFAGGPTLAM